MFKWIVDLDVHTFIYKASMFATLITICHYNINTRSVVTDKLFYIINVKAI